MFNFLTKKTIFGLVLLLILIAGTVGGVYLSQRQTQLKSRASEECILGGPGVAVYPGDAGSTEWCACAARNNDNGSLIAQHCSQAPQAATCKSDCSKCTAGNDKCGNTTYDTCDYSTCTSPSAQYTCKASGNNNCQGTYTCGSVCAPQQVCTPSNKDYANCRSCGKDGNWIPDYGPQTDTTTWCACAVKNSGAQFAQINGCNVGGGQGGTAVCNSGDYGDPTKIGKEVWCACAKKFAGDYITSPTYGGCAGNTTTTTPSNQSADTGDGATCSYETFDDSLKPKPPITSGRTYRVKVYMTNSGTNIWNKDTYKLTTRDMAVWGVKDAYSLVDQERKIKSDVASRDQAVFEIPITAPKVTRYETFPMYFLMTNAQGKWFGSACEPKEVQVQPDSAPSVSTSTACVVASEKQDEVTSVTDCSDKTKVQDYNKDPMILPYTFKDTSPGLKTIYVRFIPTVGAPKDSTRQILMSPSPVLNSISCTQSATGEGTAIIIKGLNFGEHTQQGVGYVKAKGQSAEITSWDGLNNVITANVPERLDGEIPIEVKLDDSKTVLGRCVVGMSTIQFTASTQCANTASFSSANVELRIMEATSGAKPVVSQKIDIIKGIPQNLNAKIESGKRYSLLLKAPRTLVKKVDFVAEKGTKNIGDVKLWIGDIAPVSGSDGKINSLDKSEMSRQWTTAGANSARIADLNGDNAVNSHDYSCQKIGFNQEDEGKITN